MEDLSNLIGLIRSHAWLEVSAVVVGLIIRLLKDDTFGPVVPRQWRPAAAWALGLVAAALQLAVEGHSLADAAMTAVFAPTLAMAGHHTFVEWLRSGKELRLPGLMRDDEPKVMWIPAVVLILTAPGIAGCGAHLETARHARIRSSILSPGTAQRDGDRCASLDDSQRLWGGIAAGATLGAGATGVSTIPVEGQSAETALAVTSVGLAVIAATAQYIATDSSESWARECSQ